MNVTIDRWSQVEAERKRQAKMLQTLINGPTIGNGTKQSARYSEAEGGTTFARTARWKHRREPMQHHRQLLFDAESSTRELGSRLCFQVKRARRATAVPSCVLTCQCLTSNLDG